VGRYVMSLQCPHARVQVSIAETDVEDLANNGGTAAQIEAAIRAALIGERSPVRLKLRYRPSA